MWYNTKGGELVLADDVRRRCKKNSRSILSRIEEQRRLLPWQQSWDRSQQAKRKRVSSSEETEQNFFSKTSSPIRIAGMPYLCNGRSQWAGTSAKGRTASVLASESFSSLLRSPVWETQNHWKLRNTREEKESERFHPRRTLVEETPEP